MQSDSEIGYLSLLGLLGSAVGRVKALREQHLTLEQFKSDDDASTAGIFAETPAPEIYIMVFSV